MTDFNFDKTAGRYTTKTSGQRGLPSGSSAGSNSSWELRELASLKSSPTPFASDVEAGLVRQKTFVLGFPNAGTPRNAHTETTPPMTIPDSLAVRLRSSS